MLYGQTSTPPSWRLEPPSVSFVEFLGGGGQMHIKVMNEEPFLYIVCIAIKVLSHHLFSCSLGVASSEEPEQQQD